MDSNILLFIIKMVIMGIVCFLAILIMSKTRASSWMFLVAGFLFSYIALILELMTTLGVLVTNTLVIPGLGIPLVDLLSTIIPSLCFLTSFILKLCNK